MVRGPPRAYEGREAMLPIRDRLPTRRIPYVNYALIAANLLVFF